MIRADREKIVKHRVIDYYCDICGKKIGEVEETDDGFWPDPIGYHGIESIEFTVNSNPEEGYSRHLKQGDYLELCPQCYNKLLEEMKKAGQAIVKNLMDNIVHKK